MFARLGASVCLLFLACCNGGSPSSPSIPSPAPLPAPMETPAPAPTPTPGPTPAPTGPVTLRSAPMRGANGHVGSGTARIVQDGNTFRLEFAANFGVSGASNSDVYLTNSEVGIQDGQNLGALRSEAGAQSYVLSDSGAGFRYVLIWCRPFRIPIGIGEFR